MNARRDSWSDENARARRDGCRCEWRAAPARLPNPVHPADPRPSILRKTAACAAGPVDDRYTGSSAARPAGRPARRFAAARKCRSVVWPWPFPRRFPLHSIDVFEHQDQADHRLYKTTKSIYLFGCADRCHAHADFTIVAISEQVGTKPSSRRAAEGSATRMGGSPARRAFVTSGILRPVSRSITVSTWRSG